MGGENATREGDIHSDIPDNHCRTPLLHSSDYEHERAAMILLRREEVNLDKPKNDGRVRPSYATNESSMEEAKPAVDLPGELTTPGPRSEALGMSLAGRFQG